jgi:hypothetical protein
MLYFDLPYLLMIGSALAATGIAAYAFYTRSNRAVPVPTDGDCRETRLIESGESINRDCDD